MSNMKYKVGDKVRIVEKWNDGANQNREGNMDKWLGKVMTVRAVNTITYKMVEDKREGIFHDGWNRNDACIEGLANETSRKIVITTDGDGDTRGSEKPFKSFKDFKKRFIDPVRDSLDFIPVVD